MSASSNDPSLQDQLPLTIDYPEEDEAFKNKLYDVNQRVAAAVNNKVGGLYVPQEKITGAQYYLLANPQKFRQVYRMTINFGQLPDGINPRTEPHNIPGWNSNFRLVQLYGAGTDPVNFLGIAIPNETILLRIDATDVIMSSTVNYSQYTESSVVIEYTKAIS